VASGTTVEQKVQEDSEKVRQSAVDRDRRELIVPNPDAIGIIEWVRSKNPNPYRTSAWKQAQENLVEDLELKKRRELAKNGITVVGKM